jgi:hypothetical protein
MWLAVLRSDRLSEEARRDALEALDRAIAAHAGVLDAWCVSNVSANAPASGATVATVSSGLRHR